MQTQINTLKNTLKNSLLNSSNPSQSITMEYGGVKIWMEDFANWETGEVSQELRIEGTFWEAFTPQGKIQTLKKALTLVK